MRNRLILSLALLLSVITIMAQAPQGLNYQAVARNTTGAVIATQPVGIEFSIISGTPSGTTVYKETNTATTNEFGLFTAVIGSGTAVTGTLYGINWATGGPFYLQVALDATGGTSYTNYGSPTELQSVPYALNAAGSAQWYSSGTNSITNANTGYVGIGTASPVAQLDIEETDGLDRVLNLSATITPLITVGMQGHNKFFLQDYLGAVYFYNYEDSDMSIGVNTSTELLHLRASNSSVGIGTSTPSQTLTVAGNVMINNSSGPTLWLGFGTDSAEISAFSGGLSINATHTATVGIFMDEANKYIEPQFSGTMELGSANELWKAVYSTNGTLQTSDARKKTNIQELNMGLKEVMALRPVTYDWINPAEGDDGKIGFIAQEVEKIVPQAVVHDFISDQEIASMKARNKPVPEIRDPYAMNYSEMIPVLTKAIQEQQALIIQLQKEVELLKSAK